MEAVVTAVVAEGEMECCGVLARGGLVGDRKFGQRPRARELLVSAESDGSEQLLVHGIDVEALQPGDRLRVCPGVAEGAVGARCGAIAQKLAGGPRKDCVELEFTGKRQCGSGGFFHTASGAECGLVCAGDKIQVVQGGP